MILLAVTLSHFLTFCKWRAFKPFCVLFFNFCAFFERFSNEPSLFPF